MPRIPRTPATRYGVAVLCVLLATGARLLLRPLLGDGAPFLTFFGAVTAAAALGGPGPGLLAVALGALSALYFVMPPAFSFAHGGASEAAALAAFTAVSAGIVLVCEAMRRARRRAEVLAAIVESSEDGIIGMTLDGAITSWNKGAERLYGYTAGEVIGKPVSILIPPDRRDEESDILARLRRGERVEHYETVRMRKDGSLVDISLTVSPVRGTDGRIVGASKIARDVTARRRAEEALRRREEELTDFIENSAVGLHWVASDGRILWANRAELELLGYEREEYVGRHIAEFHADPEVIEDILARLTRDETLHSYEARLRCKDGSVRHVLISSNVRRRDGEFVHTRCFTRDITDRRRAEAERERLLERERELRAAAEESNRLKDEFLATVSHELRTPLTAIHGWAMLLLSGQLDAEGTRHAFEVIERNARAQKQIIADLLDVSRIITGKMRLDVKRVELGAVVSAAAEAVRLAAESKGIAFGAEVAPAEVYASGDPDRLQQVVWNLLTNAVKFTPEGGRVTARLERREGRAVIRVEDTGPGIAPEFLPYVFDRFRQADGSTTRRHGGLGLGLAIVRHLVELHGGEARAESEGPGRGSAFTVSLPLAPAAGGHAGGAGPLYEAGDEGGETETSSPSSRALAGLRVLVVDDDADAREMVGRLLAREGAEVSTAGSAAEALAAFGRSEFDLLVSDIGMPDEDGYALVRQLRAAEADGRRRTPAIALTAYAHDSDRVRALASGFQAHVTKPVEPAELLAAAVALRDGLLRA